MKGVTLQDPTEGEPAAAPRPVLEHREPRVLRARRREPAHPRQERGDEALVDHERGERGERHARARVSAASAPRISSANVLNGARSADGFPMTTSAPHAGAASRVARYASRRRRRTRLRSTARRTWRLTAKPTRRGSTLSRQRMIVDGRSMCLPRWKSARKSALVVSRSRRGNRPVRRSAVCAPWPAGVSTPSARP